MSSAENSSNSRATRGWSLDVRSGGIVVANHGATGAVTTGSLVLRATPKGVRLRLVRYEYRVPDGVVGDGPTAPIEWIEDASNDPGMTQVILDSLSEPPVSAGDVLPMRLPPAMLQNRYRPDAFYSHVAAYVRVCKMNRIAYGPRLAADNEVSEGTVRSWVHEARARGLLDPSRPS